MSLRFRNTARSPFGGSRGEIFLELLMVVPIIVLLAMVTYEFSMALRAHQYLVSMVREASKEAFRECAALGSRVCGTTTAMDICLGEIRGRHVAFTTSAGQLAASYLRNYDIVLSGYRWNGNSTTGSWVRVGKAEAADCSTSSTCSKVSAATLSAPLLTDGTFRGLMAEKNMLIVGEIYATYNSLFTGVKPLEMPGYWVGGQYYERILF